MKRGGRIYQRPGTSSFWLEFPDPLLLGKSKRESARTTDRAEAEARLAARLAEAASATAGLSTFQRDPSISVRRLIAAYVRLLKAKGKTSARSAACALRRASDFFGSEAAASVTEARLVAYQNWRKVPKVNGKGEVIEKGAAFGTIDHEVTLLLAAFRRGVRDGHFTKVPTVDLLQSANANARTVYLEVEQVPRLLEAIEHEHLRDLIAWICETGQRVTEAGTMRWDMVRDEALEIPAASTKNRQPRQIPLSGLMAEILRRRKAARRLDSPLIFHDGDGGALVRGQSRGGLTKPHVAVWQAACAKIGRPELHVHDLRRTWAVSGLAAGLSESALMALGGWKSDATFRRYAVFEGKALRDAAAKLAEFRATLKSKR
jgi:integrase